MQLVKKNDDRLVFEVEYHKAIPERGEWMYSLGQPAEPASYEITAVAWRETPTSNPVDITEFLTDYCDKLLKEWEDELND